MQDDGWIKIHRGIRSWEWWGEPKTVYAFIGILTLCNTRDTVWRGRVIKAGSFITSRLKLAEALCLSEDEVRGVLSRLSSTGEIIIETTNRFSIITVKNWAKFQNSALNPQQTPQLEVSENEDDKCDFSGITPSERPNKSPTNPQQIPTNKNIKNRRRNIDSIYLNICPKISEDADLFGNPMPEEIKSCLSFEDFWKIYDKKVDKSACRSLYDKLPETTREEIKRHVPLYVQSTPDKTYRKDPVRYLRHRCWENEIIENTKQPQINREEEGF